MRLGFVTLFPEMVTQAVGHSILGRAQAAGLVEVTCSNPRDFATNPHRTVDDSPYGGGSGMVMKVDLVASSVRKLGHGHVVIMDPAARRFTQADARRLAHLPSFTLVCGHYEGIDERVREALCDEAFSVGDFVLTGGELPALMVADAVTRLLPGALGNAHSHQEDTFEDGLLGYPQYTRPREWEGRGVPDVLTTGDHAAVRRWRRAQQLTRTKAWRPDLLVKADLTPDDVDLL